MGGSKKIQSPILNGPATSGVTQASGSLLFRNVTKSQLGGVIFGCKNNTKNECLFKQLFGLPAQHFSYVKNIDPGLPLFLFNYSGRKLYGIFEAASSGQMNIDPYAWTTDGSDRTPFPAQVQVRVRLQCQPLVEDHFKPIIGANYYNQYHFWFELDHTQTSKLISIFSSLVVAPSSFLPREAEKSRTTFQGLPSIDKGDNRHLPEEVYFDYSNKSNWEFGTSDPFPSSDVYDFPREAYNSKQMDELSQIYLQLKEMALKRAQSGSLMDFEDTPVENDVNLGHDCAVDDHTVSEENNEKNEEPLAESSDCSLIMTQLLQEMQELKAFKMEQTHRMSCLEHKLGEAEDEIKLLRDRCLVLESKSDPSTSLVNESVKIFDALRVNLDDCIYLVGGYDGESWLSTLDSYSPSRDVMESLKSMSSVRAYATVAKLNGELYVFGGGNGCLWYDSVESYNPTSNKWTLRPSLNDKKGSLAGATLNNIIFAIGGGNGVDCFSEVEMFDIDVGRWIRTRSMLQKRFALAAAELNGIIYAVGGFDGKDYLRSAERFDPRQHSWTRIQDMNTKRGCHSLAVLNEKLYVLGGFDGSTMVSSVEIFDPRVERWVTGGSMSQSRGYSAAAVLKDTIYVMGGVKDGDKIVNVVDCYREDVGWQTSDLKNIGRRSFLSALVLDGD